MYAKDYIRITHVNESTGRRTRQQKKKKKAAEELHLNFCQLFLCGGGYGGYSLLYQEILSLQSIWFWKVVFEEDDYLLHRIEYGKYELNGGWPGGGAEEGEGKATDDDWTWKIIISAKILFESMQIDRFQGSWE